MRMWCQCDSAETATSKTTMQWGLARAKEDKPPARDELMPMTCTNWSNNRLQPCSSNQRCIIIATRAGCGRESLSMWLQLHKCWSRIEKILALLCSATDWLESHLAQRTHGSCMDTIGDGNQRDDFPLTSWVPLPQCLNSHRSLRWVCAVQSWNPMRAHVGPKSVAVVVKCLQQEGLKPCKVFNSALKVLTTPVSDVSHVTCRSMVASSHCWLRCIRCSSSTVHGVLRSTAESDHHQPTALTATSFAAWDGAQVSRPHDNWIRYQTVLLPRTT